MTDLVDYEALNALKEFLEDSFPELVDTYLPNADKYVSGIVEGVRAEDAQKVIDHAHPLKSSAGNLGLMQLHVLCRELEDMANEVVNGNVEVSALKTHAAGIEEVHQKSSEALKAEL